MSDYRVVDIEQLDTDLSIVADAVRTKIGTTESMAFPNGFVNALPDFKGMLDATIKEVVVPHNVTKLRRGSFYDCGQLEKITFHDGVTAVDSACFFGCSKLLEVAFPAGVQTIGSQTFFTCSVLQKVDCWLIALIGSSNFQYCYKLGTLIIRSGNVCALASTSAFSNTPIGDGRGYIYVPRALVDSYKSATNWSTYANQFRAIEDYPEICGGAT